MVKLQFWPFTFSFYQFCALLLVPVKFPENKFCIFWNLHFSKIFASFSELWQWLFTPFFLLSAFYVGKFNVFLLILKVFRSETGISLHIQMYKFHVSELSQPLHCYIWAAVAICLCEVDTSMMLGLVLIYFLCVVWIIS
jgi:hypothetical protein